MLTWQTICVQVYTEVLPLLPEVQYNAPARILTLRASGARKQPRLPGEVSHTSHCEVMQSPERGRRRQFLRSFAASKFLTDDNTSTDMWKHVSAIWNQIPFQAQWPSSDCIIQIMSMWPILLLRPSRVRVEM